jgi:hypothetical protein
MKRTVLLGAPSSTGKGAKELIAEAFAAAKFPLLITLENKVARAFSLPEVGVFLEPCTHSGHCKTVSLPNVDALQRLGSTIEQLGFLNNIQGLIAIEADVDESIDPENGDQNPDDENPGSGEDGDSDPNAGEGSQAAPGGSDQANPSDPQGQSAKPAGSTGGQRKNKG